MLDVLGRAIVTGAYEGQRFPTEAELASEYAVSRSVTREAVKMLTAKGLLAARARQGTAVQPPAAWSLFDPDVLGWLIDRQFSLTLLRHFTELRVAIEPAAAALAARNATDADIAAIATGLERMARAETGAGDPLEADIAFHLAVLNASENPFYQQFRDLVSVALTASIGYTNRAFGRTASVPAHRAVLACIAARDPAGAHAAMAELIDDVLQLLQRTSAADTCGAKATPHQ